MKRLLLFAAVLSILTLPGLAFACPYTVDIYIEDLPCVTGVKFLLSVEGHVSTRWLHFEEGDVAPDSWQVWTSRESYSELGVLFLDYTGEDTVQDDGLLLSITSYYKPFTLSDFDLIFACDCDPTEWYVDVSEDGKTITLKPVSIPTTALLFGSGILGLIGFRRMTRRRP